jgi:diaminopimelate decarboxylase
MAERPARVEGRPGGHAPRRDEGRFGVVMKYIDMGGGFPTVDSIVPYVEAVTGPILEGFGKEDPPLLILEPGRAIVSDAVHLVTTVVAGKS